jgi:hypothetical protein
MQTAISFEQLSSGAKWIVHNTMLYPKLGGMREFVKLTGLHYQPSHHQAAIWPRNMTNQD